MKASGFRPGIFEIANRLASRNGLFGAAGAEYEAPAERIHNTQPIIFEKKVEMLADSIRAEGLRNPAPCVKVGEDFYLVDGHHRTAAQIALGYKTIKVRAVEVSPEEWEAEIQRLKEKG